MRVRRKEEHTTGATTVIDFDGDGVGPSLETIGGQISDILGSEALPKGDTLTDIVDVETIDGVIRPQRKVDNGIGGKIGEQVKRCVEIHLAI